MIDTFIGFVKCLQSSQINQFQMMIIRRSLEFISFIQSPNIVALIQRKFDLVYQLIQAVFIYRSSLSSISDTVFGIMAMTFI